jgi:hypothetical protein
VIAAAKGTSAKLCDCEAEVLRIKKKDKKKGCKRSGGAVQPRRRSFPNPKPPEAHEYF